MRRARIPAGSMGTRWLRWRSRWWPVHHHPGPAGFSGSKRQNSGAYSAVSACSAVLKFTAPQHHPYRGRDTGCWTDEEYRTWYRRKICPDLLRQGSRSRRWVVARTANSIEAGVAGLYPRQHHRPDDHHTCPLRSMGTPVRNSTGRWRSCGSSASQPLKICAHMTAAARRVQSTTDLRPGEKRYTRGFLSSNRSPGCPV